MSTKNIKKKWNGSEIINLRSEEDFAPWLSILSHRVHFVEWIGKELTQEQKDKGVRPKKPEEWSGRDEEENLATFKRYIDYFDICDIAHWPDSEQVNFHFTKIENGEFGNIVLYHF